MNGLLHNPKQVAVLLIHN